MMSNIKQHLAKAREGYCKTLIDGLAEYFIEEHPEATRAEFRLYGAGGIEVTLKDTEGGQLDQHSLGFDLKNYAFTLREFNHNIDFMIELTLKELETL